MVRRNMVGILVMVFALGASAASANASPNVVDQYTEQVPTPGGKKPSDQVKNTPQSKNGTNGDRAAVSGAGSGGSDGPSGGSSAIDRSQLSVSGTGSGEGSNLAPGGNSTNAVAGGNANAANGAGQVAGGGMVDSSGQGNAADLASTEIARAAAAEPDSGGMGWLFPAVLVGSALLLAALALFRRDRLEARM